MKMSDKKMKNMLAVIGISSTLLLAGCGDGGDYKVNGQKVTKTYVNGVEGYYDKNGVFVPHNFKEKEKDDTNSSGGATYGTSSSGSGLGSGTSSKGGSSS